MKFICSREDLVAAVDAASKVVPNKTTLSILQCILIDATKEKIIVTANDMEFGIETVIKGDIIEKGMIAVEPLTLLNYLKKLPYEKITMEAGDNCVITIDRESSSSTKRDSSINGKAGNDFTYLPKVEKNDPVVISQFSLKEIIRRTIFSIAQNDTNKIMSGELFEINGDNLRVVSLDGHRVSICNVKLKNSYEHKKAIIPGKTLTEIMKIIPGSVDEDINIYFTDKHVMFEYGDTVIISRLIDGEYLRIEQMLSNDYETKVTISKKEFLSSIDSAMTFTRSGDKKPVILSITDGKLELKITSLAGSMKEDIDIEKSGKDIVIAFNPSFLIAVLNVIDDEMIDIYLMNSKAPCFIRDSEENYIYLVLPVQFTAAQ